MILYIWYFSIIKMAAVRNLGFSNFRSPIGLEGLICIFIPNFVKNGRMAAEILHIMITKMVAASDLGFLKFEFLNSW